LDTSHAAMTEFSEIVVPGERVCVVNEAFWPPSDWMVEKQEDIFQLLWEVEVDLPGQGPVIQELTKDDLDDMLGLTALVYPAYFRRGTAELGTYFGVREGDRLVAMAGTRMSIPGYREISAVCVHPEFRGRGLAKRLVHRLVHYIRRQGRQPFLHTEATNAAGRALYESLGFRVRRSLPLWVIQKPIP
jgi:ribosomal protein S18 acetylase RimI-like enzyme